MFTGFFSYGGLEVGNAARVQSYGSRILPTMGVIKDPKLSDFEKLEGGGYTTPANDDAPWYSKNREESARFFGFHPTAIVGGEDSTESPAITELIGDGAVAALSRSSSRELRITGFMVAEDDKALDYGKEWIKGAMSSSGCEEDSCDGQSLCFLAYLPTYEDYSLCPTRPLDAVSTGSNLSGWVRYRQGTVTALSGGLSISMPCGGDGAQRQVSSLIPGQAYRATLEISSTSKMTFEVAGVREIEAVRAPSVDQVKTTWVIDFLAPDEEVSIRVLSAESECKPATASVTRLTVRRTPRELAASTPRFSTESIREPGSWTFATPPVGVGTAAYLQPDPSLPESLTLHWANTSGSSKNVGPAHAVSRIVRALIPGQPYVAYLSMISTVGTPSMAIVGATGVLTDLGGGWYSYAFKATAPQHLVQVFLTADTAVANGASARITISYMRVELNDSDMQLPVADQLEPALRTYYSVSVIGGPSFNDMPMHVGAATKVEILLNATHPHAYTQEREVRADPAATISLIPDISCTNGFPLRTNLFTNPRFVGGTVAVAPVGGVGSHTAWTAGAGATILLVAAGTVFLADKAAKMTATSVAPDTAYANIPVTGLVAGHTYTLSAEIGMAARQAGTQSLLARRLVVVDSTGTHVSDAHPNRKGNTRVSVTFTYTPALTSVRVYHGGVTGGADVLVTRVMFEEAQVATAFFDGDSVGSVWSGTVRASTSSWQQPSAIIVTDPDCPPIPNAPQPPSIELACPISVNVWRRYFVPITADKSGGWSKSMPIVKLTTGDSVVRDVRVRFYANPFELKIEELNPCDYCGEFYISYIPSRSSMTVNGITRNVTANVSGSGETSAMNLVSNVDGGPIEWPGLRCDMPYYMTIDISPAEVLDLDVRLLMARRT